MSFTRRYASIAAVVTAAWIGAGLWLVPSMIHAAYAGRLPVVDNLLRGRGVHPVEFYLDAWRRLFLPATAALIVAAIALYFLLRYRAPLTAMATRVARGKDNHRLTRSQTVQVAAAAGLTLGFVEAGVIMLISLIKQSPRWGPGYTAGLLWMAPVANTVAFCTLAAVALLVFARVTRQPPVQLCVFLLVALMCYILTRSLRTGIHAAALFILCIGIAIQSARYFQRQPGLLVRVSRNVVVAGLAACVLCAALAAATPARGNARDALAKAWNILLIVIDTGRASNLSLYGYARNTTPNLDSFARDAVVFDRAIAPAPWTLPSHATMFTGRWPIELSTDWNDRLDERYPTVAELFADHGYATVAFAANEIYTGGRSGLDRGFRVYDGDPESAVILFKNAWLTRNIMTLLFGRGDDSDPLRGWGRKHARNVRAEFLAWLDSRDDRQQPFFAFLNYMEAHAPFLAEPPYDTMFVGRRIEERPEFFRRYTRPQIRGFVDAYDQSLASFDADFGRLLNELRARGVLDRTVVIVTSDHGELLGERSSRQLLHANSLYLPVLHVPLVISQPGSLPPQRIDREVSTRDLAVTLLDLAAVPNRGGIPGSSLAAFANGAIDSAALSPALSQLSLIQAFGDVARSRNKWSRSLIAGRYHYIVDGRGAEELFDIVADPWERSDIARLPQGQAVLNDMRARLAEAGKK